MFNKTNFDGIDDVNHVKRADRVNGYDVIARSHAEHNIAGNIILGHYFDETLSSDMFVTAWHKLGAREWSSGDYFRGNETAAAASYAERVARMIESIA